MIAFIPYTLYISSIRIGSESVNCNVYLDFLKIKNCPVQSLNILYIPGILESSLMMILLLNIEGNLEPEKIFKLMYNHENDVHDCITIHYKYIRNIMLARVKIFLNMY